MSIRVGVVGLGVMGRTHLRLLRAMPGVSVVAVADVVPAALRAAGPVTTYDDPLALVREAEVDAVLVASPDAAHAAVLLACLAKELPVLCEKPLTTTVVDAQRVVDREVAIGRRLVQVGFMRRFDPAFRAVRDAVQDGAVGRPAVVHTVHRNPVSAYPFNPSVLVTNSASHDVDLVRWTTGDEIAEVSCQLAPSPDAQFASVLLRLTTRGGVLASTELTYGPGCRYDVRCEVVGRGGSVQTPSVRDGHEGGHDGGGDWVGRFDDAYRLQDADWLSFADPPGVGATAWDGLVNAVVLAAAGQALAGGRPVTVDLPPRPTLYA